MKGPTLEVSKTGAEFSLASAEGKAGIKKGNISGAVTGGVKAGNLQAGLGGVGGSALAISAGVEGGNQTVQAGAGATLEVGTFGFSSPVSGSGSREVNLGTEPGSRDTVTYKGDANIGLPVKLGVDLSVNLKGSYTQDLGPAPRRERFDGRVSFSDSLSTFTSSSRSVSTVGSQPATRGRSDAFGNASEF